MLGNFRGETSHTTAALHLPGTTMNQAPDYPSVAVRGHAHAHAHARPLSLSTPASSYPSHAHSDRMFT
jgi:hypothetical protein